MLTIGEMFRPLFRKTTVVTTTSIAQRKHYSTFIKIDCKSHSTHARNPLKLQLNLITTAGLLNILLIKNNELVILVTDSARHN